MTQTSPPLPSSFPYPFSSLPFTPLPSPGVWGQSPHRKKIEIGFGAFWYIFVSKRQLNINIQIRAKEGLINYV